MTFEIIVNLRTRYMFIMANPGSNANINNTTDHVHTDGMENRNSNIPVLFADVRVVDVLHARFLIRRCTTHVDRNHFRSSNNDCSICYTDEARSIVKIMQCRHYFHRKCIRQWFERSAMVGNEVLCPYCRTAVTPGPTRGLASEAYSPKITHLPKRCLVILLVMGIHAFVHKLKR